MGTTLSNGVYLPDEGERNCYAGLKVNWEILNQKVADISALQLAVAGALHREIVESLPTTDIDPNTIYMVLSGTSATENVYNEFMYVNNAWELIGTSATDLTNYYTKAEVDGKLLLKASASDLTSHTGNTTIHVTASDKTKWTNSANTHVLRLALSALTPSTSDNSFSNLDDATALKVGDKVMDTAGGLFEVTAIDTQNSTFSIGTALVDLLSSTDVGDVALSNNYNDLDNLPTIPTVNDATLTIQKNGVDVQTFTANASSDVTCNITVPTKTSELTNDSGFLTSHQSLSSCVKNVVTNNQTIKSTAITRGTAPSSTQTFGIPFSDNNNKYIGNIYGLFATDMSIYVGLYAYKGSTTVNSDNVSVRVGYDASGNAYTYAPTPATTDNSTQIATTAFVKAQGYLTSHQSLANYVTTNTDQDIEGNKNFKGLLTTIPNDTIWPVTASTTDDITYLGANAIHVEQKSSGKLTDLSGGAWSVAELGVGCFFFRINNGADIRYKNFAQNTVNRIPVVSGANRFINDVTPNQDNTYNLGSSSLRWATINGVEPSSLGIPSDRSARIDISSYITNLGNGDTNAYTVPANGYIYLYFTSINGVICFSQTSGGMTNYAQTFVRYQGNGQLYAFFPVRNGDNFVVQIYTSSTAVVQNAYFIPCQGNV